MARAGDWISVLEASYSLEGDDRAWLAGIFDCIVREHWREGASTAFTFDLTPRGVRPRDICVNGSPELYDRLCATTEMGSPKSADLMFRKSGVVSTLSDTVFPGAPDDAQRFYEINPGIADALGVIVHSGSARGLTFSLLLDRARRCTAMERRRWTPCAAHIGAGLRLRARAQEMDSLDAAPIEAIFDGGGRLHDARDEATSKSARERLRDAVLRIDKARTAAGRQDAGAALEGWEALVRGRWSLVDRFDSDGRRFVVAVRNDPEFPDPRGLSLRERQVAEFVGLGRSAKEVAYLLGVPAPSVENSLRRAQAKLGLGSRVELATFFSPTGLRARLAEAVVAGETLLIGSTSPLDETKTAQLTESERGVLAMLIAGLTNLDIARRRTSSPNTVANQVQAIFRKFHARSRGELIGRLGEIAAPSSVGN